MPEETPTPPTPPVAPKSVSEQTEAKLFEEVDILVAAIEQMELEYTPPNAIAALANIQAKRAQALPLRTATQDSVAAEEVVRNNRQNVFAPLRGVVVDTVEFVESAGKPANDVAALNGIKRELEGVRAGRGSTNSVSNMAYTTRTDKFGMFIEQYEALNVPASDGQFKVSTLRALLTAMQAANTAVINAEAVTDASQTDFDKLVYTDADSLRNSALAAKSYLKSVKRRFPQIYQTISKLRFALPSRLRGLPGKI